MAESYFIPEGGISLDDDKEIMEMRGNDLSGEAIPYITTSEAWEQYSNATIYEADKRIREWIGTMTKNREWTKSCKHRRYTFSMLFEILFGRKYDQSKDQKNVYPLTKIFAYYSTRIQKSGSIGGRTYSKTIYTIGSKRHELPPYSLKLRTEWLIENEEVPTFRNMKLPKDDLQPGHARNPKTEANMERRRAQGKERWNEYQRAYRSKPGKE